MFNNMKNKIREKTGTDLPKLIAAYNGKVRSNHHSRQSSISSVSSLASEQGCKEDGEKANPELTLASQKRNGELKVPCSESKDNHITNGNVCTDIESLTDKKILKLEDEWREKEKLYVADLIKQTKELQAALSLADENGRKYQQCKEEKEEIEALQKKELSQIKQLLLDKEEENQKNETALNEANATIELLKKEISRLRSYEEQVNNFQKSSEEELLKLKTHHETLQRQFTLLEEGNKQLEAKHEEAIHNEKEKRTELNIEVNHLKEEVERLTSLLEEERDLKEKTIFRNAQISQQAQLTDQQLHKQRELNEELSKRVSTLEEMLDLSQKVSNEEQCDTSINSVETELSERIKDLEDEVIEKNKSIKNLQLKLADLKKTLQEEIKSNDNCSLGSANGSFGSTVSNEDINFKYLKHVLMKFLTSSEYEAQHLTRVVSMLLHMTPEEERLLKETLQCRMSWFSLRSRAKSRRTR